MIVPPHRSPLPSRPGDYREGKDPADQARWFTEEVQPHEPALRSFLRSKFPTLHDIDDVLQDSYISILSAQAAGRIVSTKAYLFAIARNRALQSFRKRRLYSDLSLNQLPEAWLLAEDAARAPDRTHLISLLAARLPGRCREILLLRVVRGLSCAEIAARLGVSKATVRVQLVRGRARCAEALREQDERANG